MEILQRVTLPRRTSTAYPPTRTSVTCSSSLLARTYISLGRWGGAVTIEVGTGGNLNAMMTTTPLSGTAGREFAWTFDRHFSSRKFDHRIRRRRGSGNLR